MPTQIEYSNSVGAPIPGGTAGSVLFVDSTGKLGQDNSNIFWDAANTRLGIGINSSFTATRLQVNGGSFYFGDETNTAQHIFLRRNLATIGGLSTQSSIMSIFGGTTAASHITVNSSGVVGIGIANQTAGKLSIGGNPSSLSVFQIGSAYSPTATSGTTGGIVMQSISTPASNMSGANYALFFESGTASGQGNNWTSSPAGLIGATGSIVHRGTGVVTGAAMFFTGVPTVSQSATTGAITNVYGFYCQKMKQAGVTTGYGMYQADSGDLNYFAGYMGHGQVAPATQVEMEETKTLAVGISDDYAACLTLDPGYTGAFTVTRHNYLDAQNPSVAASAVVTDACLVRFDAAAGTHKAIDGNTTKTSPGTVDAWLKYNVNGTIYYSPLYTSKTT